MACPYFFPTEKSAEIYWPFPRRLSLGAGFCGICTAAGQAAKPSDDELREFCNLGYAQCGRIPAERSTDAIRFSVARDGGDRILLHYSSEREHAPIQHGQLQYDCISRAWPVSHPDRCIQRQAECYVLAYLERREG